MKKNVVTIFTLTLLLLGLAGCETNEFQVSKTFVGGKVVDAKTLNLGKRIYTEYCMSCHGVKGDGKGISWKGMVPPPRNLTQGLYKFPWVGAGELPHDEDFYRIIKNGLKGTGMLAWDISPEHLDAVTQYIKTFAPQVWEKTDGQLGEKIVASADPFTLARKDYAVQRGKEVYHAVANCYSCHRAYATKEEIYLYSKKANGEGTKDFDETLYQPKIQESEYEGFKNLPPDFTWHEVRSATTVEELYMRLSSGVGGSGMPAWKGVLEDQDIWAVAYYVRSLMDLKEDPNARKELMDKLQNQSPLNVSEADRKFNEQNKK